MIALSSESLIFMAGPSWRIRQIVKSLHDDIVNVNGSGVGLGHPVGCTGTRIVISLIGEMKRRGNYFLKKMNMDFILSSKNGFFEGRDLKGAFYRKALLGNHRTKKANGGCEVGE